MKVKFASGAARGFVLSVRDQLRPMLCMNQPLAKTAKNGFRDRATRGNYMIPDEATWRRIERAHRDLAEAQSSGDSAGATKAWRELSDLIEGTGKGEGEPTLEDRRQEVLDALFEAAKDQNVTAILKWLDIHRAEFDRPEAPAVASENAGGSEAVPESRAHSAMIGELEDAFSGTKV